MSMQFASAKFSADGGPLPKDAFELVTGEKLQETRAAFPERSFLVDENVQAVVDRIHANTGTQANKDAMVGMYAGLWIIVAFPLGDHVSRFGMEIVNAQPPSATDPKVPLRYGLTAIFDTEPWNEKIAATPVGSQLTVLGQIEQLNPYEIRLRHCELLP